MKKNKLTIEELMEKLKEKKQRTKVVTILGFLSIVEDEETYVLYENGPLTTGMYNGVVFVRLQDGYQVFFYKKEEVRVRDKKGEEHISFPNCIDIFGAMKPAPDHMEALEAFEKQVENKKETLEKRNEKYKKIRQDHRVKHLFNHN